MEVAWKDVVPKRKAGQRALFVFLFPCLIPAACDAVALLSSGTCHSPSFSCLTFMSLCWLRAPGGPWRPLAAPLPWPRPSQAAMEMSFCLGNILLFGHSLKIVSPSPSRLLLVTLPPLSIPGGYFGISVQVNSYLTWQSFQGCQPLSCQCFKDGQPLQTAGVCTPVSPTVCRPTVFVLFLGFQPAHMLFGQDPILLVFEESRGKIKLSEDAQLACGTLILADPQRYSRSALGNLLLQSNTSALNCFWPLFL